jgi:hypothetical protein
LFPLKATKVLPNSDLDVIFSNLETLEPIHKKFAVELEECFAKAQQVVGVVVVCVISIFFAFFAFFRVCVCLFVLRERHSSLFSLLVLISCQLVLCVVPLPRRTHPGRSQLAMCLLTLLTTSSCTLSTVPINLNNSRNWMNANKK